MPAFGTPARLTHKAPDPAVGTQSVRCAIFHQCEEFMKRNDKRIVSLKWLYNPVDRLFFVKFRDKCAEHLVPDYKDACKIGIEISCIGRMVDAMVARRIEDRLKPAGHPVDGLSMDPELVKQIQSAYEENDIGVEPNHDHGQANPDQSGERTKPGLPQGGRQIVIGRGVVGDMFHPPPAGTVCKAVFPVIDEIIQNKANDGRP